jgi:hypothetical protein
MWLGSRRCRSQKKKSEEGWMERVRFAENHSKTQSPRTYGRRRRGADKQSKYEDAGYMERSECGVIIKKIPAQHRV